MSNYTNNPNGAFYPPNNYQQQQVPPQTMNMEDKIYEIRKFCLYVAASVKADRETVIPLAQEIETYLKSRF